MAIIYGLHPVVPQKDRIEKITKALKDGAVMLYPTDTVYAIGCDLNSKSAVERVRRIKQLSNDKPLTFLCSSLSNITEYAAVTDEAYRIIKRLIPGPYTFLLPATKLVPKLVMNPKRKTTGIRVPNHPLCFTLLESLGNPIISTSAHITTTDDEGTAPVPSGKAESFGKAELFDCFLKLVDIIVDDDSDPGYQVSTILDLTESEPIVLRRGLGWEAAAAWEQD
ncbi:MAG: threonylcarbamoyl-AMP synthase [Microcoleus sp. PH2017_10_PVI_O_A]|uniref:L-threonylcarbamoyladenylate synthase n=1 Tax=unclassified Microcoleus TaxID=2642155 RepID=UPI001D810E32|nr:MULTISPECIES: L-threonylcarbamoyladenylate synthase [unclassified Microcoleus]TAE84544.1 MAG: threonylcarbamoyl-AMP synthase [Oscillatoriales cyanobacterium]MCC3409110.1 threonylcarbamoyl-AMP synthase [Microcoleus sp. PH2017_10_PVI_O_A]MCC3463228.1 threonylcarbamoyl-AMP synthase [Microcoleus sp. PH2017_11_PCY_U_A]MCC3481649.1 threonylcarbamoyl-AMP synthase [Microcoleus sp. PH2017_12_PCY_D_A]MCC3528643.1 threonylcarbamoyl-AMP synthase [Microcoleus sp. PH2017_21_RUC_O_A]